MNEPDYTMIHEEALSPLKPPGLLYLAVIALLGVVIAYATVLWIVQQKTGLEVTGLNNPVGWGAYIANYVYWIAVAMSGTFISGMLYLVGSRFRSSISRAAETMTIVAVVIAGLYPLIHLGRLWVVYYMVPYPQGLQIWPNFKSPLVWDMLAISTYMIVSWILYYTGVIPDAAAAWHKEINSSGRLSITTRIHRLLALNWHGAASQWRHYKRSYIFLAALATPLAVSIHSVTSWDYSMQLLTGWHNTSFAPYFVSGAILSGCGWTLIMLIPLRNALKLKNVIKTTHLASLSLIMIPTAIGLAYEYGIEPFLAWYSGDKIAMQYHTWEATGWIAWLYWSLYFFNIAVPLTFIWKRLRYNEWYLFGASIIINIGMWLERWVLTASATSHGFLPHSWGSYASSWIELSITAGTFAFFALFVLLIIRVIPVIDMADVKEEHYREKELSGEVIDKRFEFSGTIEHVAPSDTGVTAVFDNVSSLHGAVSAVLDKSYNRIEIYTPFPIPNIQKLFGEQTSPVGFWTLIGVLAGIAVGIFIPVITAVENNLVVGGKSPVSLIPYWVIAFEAAVLFGVGANFYSFIRYARLNRFEEWPGFDSRFMADRFGLFVACSSVDYEKIHQIVVTNGCEACFEVTS
jgi:molybdopterin-containing oxidoreductase family membrane subunit